MLDIIYTSLGLAVIVLAVVYLVFITVIMIKKEYSTVPNIKVRNVMTSILCILFIFQIILSVMLTKSAFTIGSNIFCALIWAFNTILGYVSLKMEEDYTPDLEIHIVIGPATEDDEIEENSITAEHDVESNESDNK